MGFRFTRRIKILPGVRVNIGKNGISSVSVGPRGASVTAGKRGIHGNVGLPVPGLSARTRLDRPGTSRKTTPAGGGSLPEWDGQSVQLALDDEGELILLDRFGRAAPPDVVRHVQRKNKDEVAGWLDAVALDRNADRLAHTEIHLLTPREEYTFEAPVFGLPEPAGLPVPAPAPVSTERGIWTWLLHALWPPARRAWKAELDAEEARKAAQFEAAKEAERNRLEHARLEWEEARTQFDSESERDRRRWTDAQGGDAASVLELLSMHLGAIDWPLATTAAVEYSGGPLWIDIDLPTVEEMPEQEWTVRKPAKGLSAKALSETARRKDYMRHVHGIAIRMLGETFALLGCVDDVVLSGFTQRTDPATGREVEDYLFSVRVTRPAWKRLDLGRLALIDPVEALASFELRRKMTKTGIFKPIEPFAPAESV